MKEKCYIVKYVHCSVYVPNERMYNKHMEIHTVKETYYSCKDCDKTFKSNINFKIF